MGDQFGTAVVGAGILGLAVARELLRRRPTARVVVLERENRVAAHQSSHNSGVIHAGVYYAPGTLKARLCVEGASRMYDYCEQAGVPVSAVGKLIVAAEPGELSALDELERRARANGVPGLRRLRGEEIAEIEPHAVGVAALHSPRTGVVDFAAVSRRLAEEVAGEGAELRLGWPVHDVRVVRGGVRLDGPGGEAVQARRAVVCAGLWSDRLAIRAGADPEPRIVPFRGGYMRIAGPARRLVRGLVYPVPDPRLPFLGVHLTPQIGGEVLVGPSALLVAARDAYRASRWRARDAYETASWPGTWRMAARWWRTGARELWMAGSPSSFAAEARRYVPALQAGDLIPAFAGVRAQAVGRDGRLVDDFVLSSTPRVVHVRNAPSPAATSSLALAALIADAAEEA